MNSSFGILCFFLINFYAYLLAYADNKDDKTATISSNSLKIFNLDEGFEKAKIIFTGNNCFKYKNVEIFCEKISKNETDKKECIIFDGNAKIKIKSKNVDVAAKKLVLNTKKKKMKIIGDVKCMAEGVEFYTEQCNFDIINNIMTFKNYGKIKKDKATIIGKCGNFNFDDKIFSITTNVNFDNDFSSITCNKIEYKNEEITCSRNVSIKMKNTDLRINPLNCIIINEKQNIAKINGVIIIGKQFVGYGENVVFDNNSNEIIASNGVEIFTENEFRVTCDNINYNITNKKAILDGNNIIEKFSDNPKNNIYITSDSFIFTIKKPNDKYLEPDISDKFDTIDYKNSEIINDKRSNEYNLENDDKEWSKNVYNIGGRKKNNELLLKGTPFSIFCEGNVEVFSESLRCKSKNVKFEDNTITFNEKLTFWAANNQFTSDKANIYLDNGLIKKIVMEKKPFVALYENVHPNQIKCETIFINFENEKISNIFFNRDVETLLFIFRNNKLNYINNLKTERICVLFDKTSMPERVFFNRNTGKCILATDITRKGTITYLDRYGKLNEKKPSFSNFDKKIRKKSKIPDTYKNELLKNKKKF